jgi:lipopolysaccharide export system permease protein
MLPRIHDKYLLRQFVKIMLISILAFIVIFITVDTFEEIDNFIDHEAEIGEIAEYYLYSIPFILTYVIPVSLLLGTVFSMGIMARRNELTALIASGVSLIRVAAPIMVTSILVSCFSAWFNDEVVAQANRRKDDIMRYDIEQHTRSNPAVKENFHYLGENGFVYLASTYDDRTRSLYDVVVQRFDRNTLVSRIDAKEAAWEDSTWVFYNGFRRTFTDSGEAVERFDTHAEPQIRERPKDFRKEEIDQENMNYSQLKEYADKVRRTGGAVEKYLVDLYFKLSFPFAGSIFVLIGIAFASGKRKQSIASGFGVTLVVAFMYYGVLRVGQTLGHNGVIPPLFAAQMGNIIFLLIGLVLLVRANR